MNKESLYEKLEDFKRASARLDEATKIQIKDGQQWIDMMVDRNKTSHLYDEEEVHLIYEKLKDQYKDLLGQLVQKMETEINQIF